jgi:hypothetical protein
MTPFEFDNLTTHEQFVALYDYGKYLGHRKEHNYYYTFYRLEEIYLEFKYNALSRMIEGYKIFPDPNLPITANVY